MSAERLAEVAIRTRIPGTSPVFTYRVPAPLRALVRIGQLVWVPLRRQRVQGIVLDCYDAEAGDERDTHGVRLLDDIADPEAQLTPAQIKLARWISDYYHAPLYESLALTLPPGVAQEAETTWRATPMGIASDLGTLPEGERAVLYYLRQQGETAERELRKVLRGSDADLRALYIALYERGLTTRGAHFSRPKARPRIERLALARTTPAELDHAIEDLDHAPKQRAVLSLLRERGYEYVDDSGIRDQGPGVRSQESGVNDSEVRNQKLGAEEQSLDSQAAPHLLVSVAAPLAATARPYPLTALYAETGANAETLRALERRGYVELSSREVRRDPLAGDNVPPDVPPPLSSAQERVWSSVATALGASSKVSALNAQVQQEQSKTQNSTFKTFLLHGVTGSGKTEVYLRAIGRALRQGRQTLVLVPEIALTAQLVRRFAARFPGQLAVLHSGLSLGERYDEWRRLRRGEAKLAIGSRSAVFAPLPNLGLIIVDEEHETSYKHDGAPRYHARDAAQQLARITNSVLILGSATPSVESYAATQTGRITLLEMNERVGMSYDAHGLPHPRALPLPPVKIVDMRQELQKGNRSIFSYPLQSAMHQALEQQQQVILFLNRRGIASAIVCRDCGHALACPNCATPLAVHLVDEGRKPKDERPEPSTELVCHSCNHRALIPMHCPECWSPRIKAFGVGTQRVVDEVEAMFPEARVLRWDRDSVSRKGDHTRMLDRFLSREADVLVGTQMIAKGLDFPLVSVVGVVAADTALNLPDFRAGERTFQLLTQVAGRAGRRVGQAQVVLQTYSPDHYALLAAQEHDYRTFFTQEIAFRRQTAYPPYARLVRFVYTSGSDARCQREAERLAAAISEQAVALDLLDWSIIGPAPAFFHRQRNRFRWHVILRTPNPGPLIESLPLGSGWSLDVDPVNVL